VTESSVEIYTRALALLARREHSRQELRQKLLFRYPNQQILVSEVLSRLEEEAYQSDVRFVEAYVRARQIKGIGTQRLRQELRMRGIEDQVIEQALMSSPDDDDTLQWILRVWQKKFATLPADAKEKHRQVRFLLYRGFRQQDVEHLFLHLKENALEQ
jgi:regulatory protein